MAHRALGHWRLRPGSGARLVPGLHGRGRRAAGRGHQRGRVASSGCGRPACRRRPAARPGHGGPAAPRPIAGQQGQGSRLQCHHRGRRWRSPRRLRRQSPRRRRRLRRRLAGPAAAVAQRLPGPQTAPGQTRCGGRVRHGHRRSGGLHGLPWAPCGSLRLSGAGAKAPLSPTAQAWRAAPPAGHDDAQLGTCSARLKPGRHECAQACPGPCRRVAMRAAVACMGANAPTALSDIAVHAHCLWYSSSVCRQMCVCMCT
mmetsp:Transcript_36029/g.111967  ORF Transcript_36029/g.111967 Transcript_36029/m.111967 type:complete len:257 (+) Transcript_36029:538-1308(+)